MGKSVKRAASSFRGGGCCTIECFDRFQSSIGLSVGEADYTYGTGWGACLTILVIIVTGIYAGEKLFVEKLL